MYSTMASLTILEGSFLSLQPISINASYSSFSNIPDTVLGSTKFLFLAINKLHKYIYKYIYQLFLVHRFQKSWSGNKGVRRCHPDNHRTVVPQRTCSQSYPLFSGSFCLLSDRLAYPSCIDCKQFSI